MTYTIDLDGADTRAEIHERIRRGLPVPEYYGNNLDALHDVLTSMCGYNRIIFIHSDGVGTLMKGYVEALRWMCSETVEEVPEMEIIWG